MLFRLLLMRHGPAVERADFDGPDADRPLTPAGRVKVEAAVAGLRRLPLALDIALHSPWLRAAETARLLSPLPCARLAVAEALARTPDAGTLAALIEVARANGARRGAALVGHEPFLTELLGLALASPGLDVAWKKAGIALLDVAIETAHRHEDVTPSSPPRATLVAFVPPKWLRALADAPTSPPPAKA